VIGLDSGVLVRYFTQDEPRQARAARELINDTLTPEHPGHVAAISLAEFAWVLQRLYGGERDEIAEAIEGLLTAPTIVVEHKSLAWKALRDFRASGLGFADCLVAHINLKAGCDTTCTFDRDAAKVAGFRLL
jgi:predicted nucleic-acid-binding protein